MFRVDLEGPVQGLHRLGEPAEFLEGKPSRVPDTGLARVDLEGPVQGPQGLGKASHLHEGDAPGIEGRHVPGVDLDDVVDGAERLLGPFQPEEDETLRMPGAGVPGCELQGVVQGPEGLVGLSQPHEGDALRRPGGGMPRVDPEGPVQGLDGIGGTVQVDEGDPPGVPGIGAAGVDGQEPVEGLEGGVGPLQLEEGMALRVQGAGMAGLPPEDLVEGPDRLPVLLLVPLDLPEGEPGIRVGRVQLEGLSEGLCRLGEPAQPVEGEALLVPGTEVPGVYLEREEIVPDPLLEVLLMVPQVPPFLAGLPADLPLTRRLHSLTPATSGSLSSHRPAKNCSLYISGKLVYIFTGTPSHLPHAALRRPSGKKRYS